MQEPKPPYSQVYPNIEDWPINQLSLGRSEFLNELD